jgi:hypothetical protein
LAFPVYRGNCIQFFSGCQVGGPLWHGRTPGDRDGKIAYRALRKDYLKDRLAHHPEALKEAMDAFKPRWPGFEHYVVGFLGSLLLLSLGNVLFLLLRWIPHTLNSP